MSYRHATLAELLESRTLLSATLVKDINVVQAAAFGSGMTEMKWAGNVAYIAARDNAHGYELWKSDGTNAGTSLVLDIAPGKANASPSSITPVGAAGSVFFAADDGVGGTELWHSDGTAGGTSRVLDINPGAAGSNPANLTDVNGTLYFTADDGTNGVELWKSDGTASGTSMVVDLNGGPHNGSSPSNLFNFNGTLFFTTFSSSGTLYKTDGTAGGTTTVIAPTGPQLNARSFVSLGGSLYFLADTGVTSSVWKSDGTSANTIKVYTHSTLEKLMKVGSVMYFVDTSALSGDFVYRTDGTPGGAVNVTGSTAEAVGSMVDLNGRLVYGGSSTGDVLKQANGGAATTISTSVFVDGPFTAAGGFAYFQGVNAAGFEELYRADGTTVSLVKDINPGAGPGYPSYLTPMGVTGDFLMNANDGTTGGGLMRSSGTAATTVNVKDINDATASSNPQEFAALNGKMYFSAVDGVSGSGAGLTAGELFVSDGTAGGTHLFADLAPGIANSGPAYLTSLGNKIVFTASDGAHGRELWTTDGTVGGTSMIADVQPGSSDGIAAKLYRLGSYIYFVGTSTGNFGGRGVWRTDGTAGGTIRLTPNTFDVQPTNIVLVNEKVMWADSSTNRLWVTDGTLANTTTVLSGVPMNGSIESTGSRAIFGAGLSTTTGYEIWSSDGTPGGTSFIKDIRPGTTSSGPNRFVPVDGAVVFIATDGNAAGFHGAEMWRSDGTPDGTFMLMDIRPGTTSSVGFGNFIEVNGVAYFQANDGVHGIEPWRTDGTTAGTRLLKDINPGSATSSFEQLTAVNGYVYFQGDDGAIGDEGWVSDGTTAGTVSLGDLNLGPAAGSAPREFFAFGDAVYFYAVDPDHGAELYRIDAPTFATLSSGTLTINGTDNDDTLHVSQPGDGTIRIDFNGYQRTYALADVSAIVFNGNDASDTLAFDTAVTTPVSFVGGAGIAHTVDVNAGTRTFATDLADIGPSVNVNVAAGASAIFNATQHLASLHVDGSAQLSAGGSKLLQTGALSIGDAGQLDLTDNDLLATSTPKSMIESYITTAYNFGGWDGTHGLFSSAARDNPNGNTTLGSLSGDEFNNNNGGTFNGVAPNTNDVLVKYTYFGDVDFNGSVDVSDYNLIDFGFSNHLSGWGFGDADYSGAVDVSDYNLIDFAFSTQTGAL